MFSGRAPGRARRDPRSLRPRDVGSRNPRTRRFRPRRDLVEGLVAEGVGFEPTRAVQTPLIFETSALNHSAIPPKA